MRQLLCASLILAVGVFTVPASSQPASLSHEIFTFENMLRERRVSMAKQGSIFEFNSINHAWGYRHSGCLIGAGQILAYNFIETPWLQLIGTPDPREVAMAESLPPALVGQLLTLPTKGQLIDFGQINWTATVGDTIVKLKQFGDSGSLEHSDNEAQRLIILINRWCPKAAGAFRSWETRDKVIQTENSK